MTRRHPPRRFTLQPRIENGEPIANVGRQRQILRLSLLAEPLIERSNRAHRLSDIVVSSITFLLLPAFVAYMNRVQLSPEERTLSATFGDEWETHQQAVTSRLM